MGPMEGVWSDPSAFYEAGRQGKQVDLEDFAERELVHLTPIPCWRGLSEEELRERLADLLTCRTKPPASENGPRRSLRRASAFEGGAGTGEVRPRGRRSGPQNRQHRQRPRIGASNRSHDA